MNQTSAKHLCIAIFAIVMTSQAYGAGFEKNIMWSGRYSGAGGAAIGHVQGAEALYWNPAGLVSTRVGKEVTLNVSPLQPDSKGPFVANESLSSDNEINLPFGLIYSQTVNESWAWAVGSYVSGGSGVEFNDVNINANLPNPAMTIRPDIRSALAIVEVAAGAGYKINEQWKVGASLRYIMARARIQSVAVNTTTFNVINFDLNKLEADEFGGARLGLMYTPNENWSMGVSVRTEAKLELEGELTGQTESLAAPGTISETTGSGGKASATFPLGVGYGAQWKIVPDRWHLAFQYWFTQYSVNEKLELSGTIAGTELTDIPLNWKDQHSIGFGGEFLGTKWPIRAGLLYTSQVIPEHRAVPTFSSPGAGYGFTLGTGHAFNESLRLDLGFEYSWIKADVSAEEAAAGSSTPGKYETVGTALHTGLTYNF